MGREAAWVRINRPLVILLLVITVAPPIVVWVLPDLPGAVSVAIGVVAGLAGAVIGFFALRAGNLIDIRRV